MSSQFTESAPHLLILITLVPLLILDQPFTITGQETGKALIAKTCNTTEYPKDCMKALESDPRSFNVSNVSNLTRIGLEITASKANYSLSVARYWLSRSTDYATWSLIGICVENYENSVGYMNDSLKAFDELKYKQSYQSLVSVNSSVVLCQDTGLEVFNGVNTMMSRITKDFMSILHMLF